jgi:hypothetical protein
LPVLAIGLLAATSIVPATLSAQAAAPGWKPMEAHVSTLADSSLEGRMTGSPGARQAAAYVAQQLEKLGILPLPGQDSYEIPFDFTAGSKDIGSTLDLIEGEAVTSLGGAGDVQALSFSDNDMVEGELVFAGYGLSVPNSDDFGYDSYATLDVKDKIVVVLRYFPEEADQDTRARLARYSGLRYKAMTAREHGAKGILLVTGPNSPNAGELIPMTFDTAIAGSGIVAASISGAAAEKLFSGIPGQDRSLQEIQAEFDTANPHTTGFAMGKSVRLETRIERERRTGYNVAGMLRGSNPSLAEPWVLVGAHYDHLGHGKSGNSLASEEEAGGIHHGADDNASGVAAVLGAAARLEKLQRSRNVAFLFWSGEELGLLGSTDFVNNSPIALDQVAGYINFDMVGRSQNNKVTLQAVGSSPDWQGLIERANVPVGFDISMQTDPYLPTDSSAFNSARVPTLNFFTGSHSDYHRPSDTADKINYEDLDRIAQLGALVAQKLANQDQPPEFVEVERKLEEGGGRDSVRAYTGTIPDYATEVEGLLLGGVMAGGPASEAGLAKGDIIVEFAGQEIKNIYDYTYALDAVKIDVPIQVVYLRDGERLETTLTPRSRK